MHDTDPPAGQAGWLPYEEAAPAGGAGVVGTVLLREDVFSPQLGNRRHILAYLPPSYAGSGRSYPVLYMHDGQNLFDEATSFSAPWDVDLTMEALGRRGVEAIVIAVPNMGEERLDEYSPFVDAENGGGRGDLYLGFLADTLKPLVDAQFRTLRRRGHTGIAGSSMGGLISLYGFFRRGEVFGVAGVMSPALWFADRAIFDYVERAGYRPGRLHLDVGTAEGEEAVEDARRMRDLLVAKGYRRGEELRYVEEPGATHEESAWRERMRLAVPFLLG